MAKGYQRNKERQQLLSSFGRELARRSKSHCELCAASGVPLSVFEVEPHQEDPIPDRCIFICGSCLEQIEYPKRMIPDHWRALGSSMWSEVMPVQVMAVRLLRRLSNDHLWASDLCDQLYLMPEVESWVEAAA